jgi:CheY-like chemotaxis protein
MIGITRFAKLYSNQEEALKEWGEKRTMKTDSPLQNKHVLIVDDESDILEFVEDELDMCIVDSADNYETALQYLQNYTYDMVILDIMGVNGYALLEEAVSKGFPAVMLTSHALSEEALKKSIKLGAVSYLPKDKMSELRLFLEDVVLAGGKSVWYKLFDRLGDYFNRRFGPDWKERDKFLKEFFEELKTAEVK